MSFFPVPTDVSTQVWARLPDRFRKPRRTAWADANKGGASIDSFLEGPCFDRAGNLYVTDIPFGRVFRITADGTWELVVEYDGWPNGMAVSPQGEFVIADYRNGIMRLDVARGSVEPLLPTVRSEGFKGVNDLVFARNGDLYFTDQGQTGMHDPSGRVYRLAANGRLDCLLHNGPSPNGIALSTDESVLFVALTRANQIWRAPLGPDSSLSKVCVFVQLPGGISGPDGLAVDADNGLAICDPGHGCVWLVNRLGEPQHRVRSCAGLTLTNLAYGGPSLGRLFITDSLTGQILVAEAPVKGHRAISHV